MITSTSRQTHRRRSSYHVSFGKVILLQMACHIGEEAFHSCPLSCRYQIVDGYIRSEFSIKIRGRPLVKIDHVIFVYVTTPHSESAVLAITHENRALLQMASRFAQVGEEEISQIISDLCTGYL